MSRRVRARFRKKSNNDHITLRIDDHGFDGISIHLSSMPSIVLRCFQLFGTFNAHNIAMAALIVQAQGIDSATIAHALATFPGIPGRLQKHKLANEACALVDYAHNAASFQEILSTLRPYTDHLIVVFGCGGNRDKARRPAMGNVAAQYADVIILTDDNPRFEDRLTIIHDIIDGIPLASRDKIICEPDRRLAIQQAAQLSRKSSIIALLGKGHENYYIINGTTQYFDDFEEIRKF